MNLLAIEQCKVLFFWNFFRDLYWLNAGVSLWGKAGSSLFHCNAVSIRLCLLIFVFWIISNDLFPLGGVNSGDIFGSVPKGSRVFLSLLVKLLNVYLHEVFSPCYLPWEPNLMSFLLLLDLRFVLDENFYEAIGLRDLYLLIVWHLSLSILGSQYFLGVGVFFWSLKCHID